MKDRSRPASGADRWKLLGWERRNPHSPAELAVALQEVSAAVTHHRRLCTPAGAAFAPDPERVIFFEDLLHEVAWQVDRAGSGEIE